jgi:dihydroxyacid dehydratase/phosphogluconate dehydratase
MAVTGRTLEENLASLEISWDRVLHPDVLRPLDNPLRYTGGLTLLKGNLVPQGR